MKGLVALACLLALAGCGDDSTLSSGGGDKPRLVVSAASSLKAPLTTCARDYADADLRLQFAGSDDLAAQIRQGVPVDVFASANTALPDALASEGKLDEPVRFATNKLVLAVPAKGSSIASLDDVSRSGVTLVMGAEGVPVGDYTRKVLGGLGARRRDAVLANVRSNEPDVQGVVGKLAQGAADAGFVYATDVQASGGRLNAIPLPEALRPTAAYAAGVVKGSDQADAAEGFVDDLLAGGCHEALLAAGFGEP
jgi:molybdate transport system substrate-binding protein